MFGLDFEENSSISVCFLLQLKFQRIRIKISIHGTWIALQRFSICLICEQIFLILAMAISNSGRFNTKNGTQKHTHTHARENIYIVEMLDAFDVFIWLCFGANPPIWLRLSKCTQYSNEHIKSEMSCLCIMKYFHFIFLFSTASIKGENVKKQPTRWNVEKRM